MGGIGKTALGLVVAHQLAEKFPDAQIFLDLKGTTTPLSAIEIARQVILSFEPGADLRALDENNFQAYYQHFLHGKKVLLFFDNARSAEQIAPLRPPATGAMLVTSRWTFPVAGLKNHKVGVMDETEAQNFLLELCPRIDDKAADLAKACGYLPLALRIAGSFLQVNEGWSVEKYLTRLSDRKNRLTALIQSREEAELQNTEPDLLAAFELSYNQLKTEDQQCWRMLGVFSTSFDSQAVSAMWETDEDETTKLLSVLRRYSLLDYDDGTSRYNLHDLLADFGLRQMKEGEEHEARFKHASYYRDMLSVANDLYLQGGENILLALKLFDIEWEHVRLAQAWSRKNSDDVRLLELVNEYPNAGYMIFNLRLNPREHINWLESSLQAARSLGNKKFEGYHLGNLGIAHKRLGETRKGIEFYEQQLIIVREIGDRWGEGNACFNMGLALYVLEEKESAIDLVRQALKIFEAIELPAAERARKNLKEWGVVE